LKFGLLTPDGSHLWEGVALDHRLARPYELMNLWGGGRPTPALSVEVEAISLSRRWLRAFDPFALGEQRSDLERWLPKLSF
jgi:hypothetical protein